MVLILDFKGLNVYITFIRKVDAITSVIRKNSKSLKFQTSPISVKFKNQAAEILFAIVKNYLAQKSNFAELGENPTF